MEKDPQETRAKAREWALSDLLSVAAFAGHAIVDESDYEPPETEEPEVDVWQYQEGTLVAEKEPDHGECPAITSDLTFDTEEVR